MRSVGRCRRGRGRWRECRCRLCASLYPPPPAGNTGCGAECERVSRCGKISKNRRGMFWDPVRQQRKSQRNDLGAVITVTWGYGATSCTGLSHARQQRYGSPLEHASPLAIAPSLSPETVRRGGERDRYGITLLGGSNRVTTRIVRRVSGSTLPCWIVDRISTSSINKRRHGNCSQHVGKFLGVALLTGDQSGHIVGEETLSKWRYHPLLAPNFDDLTGRHDTPSAGAFLSSLGWIRRCGTGRRTSDNETCNSIQRVSCQGKPIPSSQ